MNTARVFNNKRRRSARKPRPLVLPSIFSGGRRLKTHSAKKSGHQHLFAETLVVGLGGFLAVGPYGWLVAGAAAAAMLVNHGSRGLFPGALVLLTSHLGQKAEPHKGPSVFETIFSPVKDAEAAPANAPENSSHP